MNYQQYHEHQTRLRLVVKVKPQSIWSRVRSFIAAIGGGK